MKMKKRKGSLEIFIASVILTIVPLIIVTNLKLREIKVTNNLIEDGLVASNLAAATIDLKEYGTTKNIINMDHAKSFNDFEDALKVNLKLDDNFEPKNKRLISSRVSIEKFTIYNVMGNNIQVVNRNIDGSFETTMINNGFGSYKTPDGVLIKTTTIYSRISFKVKGLLGLEYDVFKQKSVDVSN